MTAMSTFSESHEPSTAFTQNDKNSDGDSSKRKWKYRDSNNSTTNNDTGDELENEESEPNCSGCDDIEEFLKNLRIPISTPTFSHIPWAGSKKYPLNAGGLHYELIECYGWLRPSEAERFARVNVCQRVKAVVASLCPDAGFFVFGSVATMLFLPTSDIDITVEIPGLTSDDMKVVASALKNSNKFTLQSVLDRSYVPIIKLTDKETGLNIDISFNTAKAHSAVEYIWFMRYWFPSLELITLILKQFLASRQLNQAFTGGLSSYGLVLMIVHYMLRFYRDTFFMQNIIDLQPGVLGDFFMGFLKYYGTEFDPRNDALAFPRFDEATLVSKAELTTVMHENLFASVLCVQDPITPLNDVGRGAHNFMQVRDAFQSAYTKLDEIMSKKRSAKPGEPLLQSIMTFSSSFVEFRKKINELPFGAFEEHNGNEPRHFGGQYNNSFGMHEARNATILPPLNFHLAPRIYAPPPHQITEQQSSQPAESTFEENPYEQQQQQQLAPSETSSSTAPTPCATSPQPPDSPPRENGYFPAAAPAMPQMFFPPPPPQMLAYNPYFSLPPSIHPPTFSPQSPYYLNGYTNSYSNGYDYVESSSYCDEQQLESEDDMLKQLSINDDEEEEESTKCGNNSDDSDSSGLSTGSSDSLISCSTVSPDYTETSSSGSSSGIKKC